MSRKILKANLFQSGYGRHKYHCEWIGEWDEMELITAIDNQVWDNPTEKDLQPYHYGGNVENKRKLENGNYAATICVYYD